MTANKRQADVAFGSQGVVAELIRDHDWSRSPLGPPRSWPQSLRSVVSLMLTSKFPMSVAWGPSLAVLYNDSYIEILGNKHPAALGCPMAQLWAEVWTDVEPLVRMALAGEAVYRQDLPMQLRRRGYEETAWFTFSYSPVQDESGEVGGMFCVVAETTSQVRAQRRQRLQLELDSAQAGLSDVQAIMTATNTALGRHLGASRVGFSEVSADGLTVQCRACYSDGVAPLLGVARLADFGPQAVARQLAGQTEVADDIEHDPQQVHATWRAIDTRAYVSAPLLHNGRPTASLFVHFRQPHHWLADEVALIEDIGARTWAAIERARAVAALRESETRFRALVTAGGYTVYRMSPDWQQMRYLQGQTFVRDSAASSAAWMDAYLHPDDRAAVVAAAEQAMRTRGLFEVEHRVRLADDRYGWMYSRAVPILGDAGEVVEWFGAALDVTERKRNEEALRQLTSELEDRVATALVQRQAALDQVHEMQKMETIGQLTGGVAHDFNNLLTPIVGALDLLAHRLGDDARARRLAEGGLQAAERARVLIQRLLAFSRRQHLAPQPVHVGKLMEGVLDMVSRTVGPRIKVTLHCATELPPVMVDPNQLELALLNLAVNARDAMPDGGTLLIGVVEEMSPSRPQLNEGRFLRFFVTDTGVGMDSATARRAVEPFFTTKGVGRGTGLGLSSVHGLAVQSGGDFAMESAPGEGTTVTLWLPVSDLPLQLPLDAASDSPIRCIRPGVVLLVDDEELVRAGTTEMLLQGGYRVVQAASGYEALRQVHEGLSFDVLLTDYAMPGMSGTEVARAVRKLRPGMPVLLITGYAQLDEREAGGLPRLAKPFRQGELVTTLAGLLDEAAGEGYHGRPGRRGKA